MNIKSVIEEIELSGYEKELVRKGGKKVLLEAVKYDAEALKFASKRLQGNKKIVLEAVKQNGSVLQYASKKLQGDKEVVIEAVKNYGEALKYASE